MDQNNLAKVKSFAELAKEPAGTILEDWFEDGIRCIITRGPVSLCAYIGIPESHPLANRSYDDIPLDCHGGLTFSGKGDDKYHPKGLYWYGWDYAHAGDRAFYDIGRDIERGDHEWTVEEVKKEFWSVVYSFKKLMHLVEK